MAGPKVSISHWFLYMLIILFCCLQLLRKHHIGNDIVTVIFQDPGAQPFCAKNIRSQFQHVFVVIKALNKVNGGQPVKYK